MLSIDHKKIKRVFFFKILRNSIEAMPGGGKITVKLDIIDKFVEVNITDTGPGIPEEIRNQLFQPFFSTKSSSLGLGLSFCKLAIESNRESIGIYSVVREGTTVSVRLPLYPFDGVITLKPPDISDKIAQAKDKLEGVRQQDSQAQNPHGGREI